MLRRKPPKPPKVFEVTSVQERQRALPGDRKTVAQETRYKLQIEPIELLNHLLEQNGLSHKDLAEILGVDISSAAGILKGTRSITPAYAQRLGERFELRPALFLALEYRK